MPATLIPPHTTPRRTTDNALRRARHALDATYDDLARTGRRVANADGADADLALIAELALEVDELKGRITRALAGRR